MKMLRPLHSINRVRGMRVLVQTILKAGPQICNVLLFLMFFLIVFSLFGVSFFRGNLRHTCHVESDGEWVSTGVTCDAECSWDPDTLQLIGCSSLGEQTRQLEGYAIPWRWTYSCRPGQECRCRNSGGQDPAACTFRTIQTMARRTLTRCRGRWSASFRCVSRCRSIHRLLPAAPAGRSS